MRQKRQRPGKPQAGKGSAREKKIGKEEFKWQEQPRGYRCPEGHLLQLGRIKSKAREGEDGEGEEPRGKKERSRRAPGGSRCTSRPHKGRTVDRMVGQE